MLRPRLIIFDVDETLIDFRGSQRAALEEIRRRHYPQADAGAFHRTYAAINDALWSALHRGEIDQAGIRRERFARTAARLGLPPPAEWRALGDDYEDALARHGALYPGVAETLARLATDCRLAAVTNGLARVQRPKAARTGLLRWLDPYVVSEEEGVAKPSAEIFARCLARAGARPAETLVVGDSWESDGAGAAAAGLAFCWVRPPSAVGARPPHLPAPVLEIGTIAELPDRL